MSELGVSGKFVLVTLVSLFTIVNPLGATGLFFAHTSNLSRQDTNAVARRASLACALVLMFFALSGQILFQVMGISIPAFRIAGGILLFRVALDMLKGANVRTRTLPEEQKEAESKEDISIIPLAVPLLSGPGAITTVIVLMTRTQNLAQDATVLGAIAVISLVTYLILSHSSLLHRVIGQSGVRIMNRLLGLVLASISIQFVINGVKDLLPEFGHILKSAL